MAGNETEKEWEQDMISYVKGPLMGIEEDVIVVEAGSLGLAVHVPVSLLPELPGLGQEVTVYTYFQVREDAMTLYGFLHPQDRDMFRGCERPGKGSGDRDQDSPEDDPGSEGPDIHG